ncbi:MAG TPA: hypothetical protein VGG98_05140 [Solirubrobacteraceae bacterium]
MIVHLRGPEPSRLRLATRAVALALAGVLAVLVLPPSAHAASSTPATKGTGGSPALGRTSTTPVRTRTSSTPTFPIPATAKPQPSTGTPATGTSSAGSPTTTYVPEGAPATTSPNTATGATTIPTVAAPSAIAPLKKNTVRAPASARARQRRSRTLSPAAIAIAVVAALLVLACSAWGLARRRAFEPHWALSLRHALAEAGLRSSLTWSEFVDWARIGR